MDAAATGQASADATSRFAVTHVVHNAGAVRPALLPDVELDDLQALSQLHLGAAIAPRAGGLAGDEEKSVRPHRPDVIARRARPRDADRLCGDKGRHGGRCADLGAGACRRRDHRERGRAGADLGHRNVRSIVPENSEREKALAAAIPVKRLGQSDDVARAVMFFCDRANGFVTGQTLYVCGGASLGTIVI